MILKLTEKCSYCNGEGRYYCPEERKFLDCTLCNKKGTTITDDGIAILQFLKEFTDIKEKF